MLEIRNLRKSFPLEGDASKERRAVQGIDLTLDEGDFLVVIGGNGSGKSTLLNLIAGTIRPDEGDILIDGTSLDRLPERKRARFIGRVFQDPKAGSIGDFTLFENLALALNRGHPHTLRWSMSKERRAFFVKTLSPLGLGLETRLDERMSSFSGGERQAVTLLMSTFNDPKLLLLDEHTSALDPKTSAMVLALTDRFASSIKGSTLMITHNLKDAIAHGNRLLMMKEGRAVYEASAEEKAKLTVADLIAKYGGESGEALSASALD
ncbi:MAG: ATP-binding cassette domain-containing protein [Bacilli bacterium]|jgi:putative ABC transport system ATP-binding protein|nr:ATP-binding cassette domain-containing protein [Bacilli bacterium]